MIEHDMTRVVYQFMVRMWRLGGGDFSAVDTRVERDDGVSSDPVHERGNQGEGEKEGTKASSNVKATMVEVHASDHIDVGGGCHGGSGEGASSSSVLPPPPTVSPRRH